MQLRESLAKLDQYIADHLTLNDGLSSAEIDQILAVFPYPIPAEVYELYQWHNGDRDWDCKSDGLIKNYVFLPLESVISEYNKLLKLNREANYTVWHDRWLPLFQFDAQQFHIIIADDHQEPSSGIYDLFLQNGTPQLRFSSIQEMVELLSAAYAKGVYQWQEQQKQLVVDELAFADLIKQARPTQTLSILEQLSAITTADELDLLRDQLIQLKDKQAIPLLCKLLDKPDPRLQSTVAIVLGEIKDSSAIPQLIELLNNTDNYTVKLSVLNALFSLPDPQVIPHLPLQDQEVSIRAGAITTLHAIVIQNQLTSLPFATISALENCLEDQVLSIGLASAGILCQFNHDRALQVIAQHSQNSNLAVRLKAIAGLARCTHPLALEILQPCLNDSDPNVRLTAQNVWASIP